VEEMRVGNLGKINGMWKGNKVGYRALHSWIERTLGKAKKYSFDSGHISNRYEWANKGHTYRRNTKDWIELCHKCHMKYDNNGEKVRLIRIKKEMPIINKIREMYKTGNYKQYEIAKIFGFDQSNISKIVRRHTWDLK